MSDLDELERLLREATAGPWVHWAGTGLIIRPHSGADCAEDLRVCEVSVNTFRDQGRHNADLIAALRNHAEELIRDARRYRWLKRGDNDEKVLCRGPVDMSHIYLLREQKLDEAIDAAIAQEGKG